MTNTTMRNAALFLIGLCLPTVFIGCGQDPAEKPVRSCEEAASNAEALLKETISRGVDIWDYNEVYDVRAQDITEYETSSTLDRRCEGVFTFYIGEDDNGINYDIQGNYDVYRSANGEEIVEISRKFASDIVQRFNRY